MRKNLIAMSVAAFVGGLGMAGGAAAAVIADVGPSASDATREDVRQSGTGHQLIVPYFNTQVGNATLFNIVNTDTINGKAVKIRFRGASNSDDIFDFQLYMSPGDHWAANISRGATGVTTLTTPDKSCTIPTAVGKDAGGVNSTFVLGRLPSTLTGDALAAETREGYIEIFNMADVPPNAIDPATGNALVAANPLFTTIKHVSGVAPCATTTAGAAALNALAVDPADLAAARTMGFRAPTTGLFANWTIVNVPKSGSSSGEAIALTASIPNTTPGALNTTPARGNIVFFPQVNGAVANVDNFTADPSFRTNAVTNSLQPLGGGNVGNGSGAFGDSAPYGGTTPILVAQFFDLPDLSTPYLVSTTVNGVVTPRTGSPTDPILFVNNLQTALATSSISNEYLTDTTINAFTDWSLSQPTRRYAVVADYRPLTASPVGPIGRAFTRNEFYTNVNTGVNTAAGKTYQICADTQGVVTFDREETQLIGTNFVVSPNPPAPQFRLCGETSVLTFNSTGPSVLGATVAQANFTAVARDGWARLGTQGSSGRGLPIVGKAFVAAATGTFNIGASWEHRYVPTAP